MATLDPYEPEDDQTVEYLSLERAKLLDAIERMDFNLFLAVCAFSFALSIDVALLFVWFFLSGKDGYFWIVLILTILAVPINMLIYKLLGKLLKL